MATQAQLKAAREETINRRVEEEVAKRMAAAQARMTAAQHVDEVQPEAAAADIGSLFENLPSPSRVIVGFILGLLSAGLAGYGIGTLMSYALAGIATLTGSTLLAFMLTALVWIVGIYASWKVGGWVGSKVFTAVVLPDGLVSKCYASLAQGFGEAKAAVTESDVAKRARAFTGAFTQDVEDVVVRA